MTDRENFFETVRFGRPERVMQRIPAYGLGYLGVNHQGYGDAGMDDAHDRPVGSVWKDIWGTGWHKEYPDVMGFPKEYPLADMSNLKGYKWPDPDDERLVGRIYEGRRAFGRGNEPDSAVNSAANCRSQDDGAAGVRCDMPNVKPSAETIRGAPDENSAAAALRGAPEDKIISGAHRDTLWEKSYMLVGMENIMTYFYTEPEYAREILRRIMDFQLGIAKHYVAAGIELAGLGDDLGTQRSLLLSPEIVDGFLVPEYRRLFDFYKSRGVLVNFHSCGHVEPLLETFIDLGVNILNPVQVTANSLVNIIGVTRGRMALAGGISTKLIMEGTPQEIRETVKNTIRLLGADGGYFCDADQGMPFPPENAAALASAVAEFGSYPPPRQ